MSTIASFTLADGAWIFGGLFAAAWLVVAFAYYTRRGSTINQRPHGSVYSGAPGAKTPSVLSHDQSAASGLLGRRENPTKPPDASSEKRRPAARRKRQPSTQS
jgi:hypothetical protein